ncbi:microvitellogenin [Bombyx mori]|uniref:Microvitellogenin-like n=1 Tax=Bombyx mori TaxID=7091 RepID=A0A8R2DMZ0_BOMMO|nr:microvitellogenin [Bombyx mori]
MHDRLIWRMTLKMVLIKDKSTSRNIADLNVACLGAINMKFLLVIPMCVLAAGGGLLDVDVDILSAPDKIEADNLYSSVITGDIDKAVVQTLALNLLSKGAIIEDVIARLIRDKKRNIFDYAYKLWNGEGKDVVKQHFPMQFRLIFAENHVKIINKRDNLAIKLSTEVDHQNDRSAFGDANEKTTDNVGWRFVHLWENNKVYFKIVSVARNQFLKLGTDADEAGDHIAYGADVANTFRHQWYLQPAKYEDDLLFLIYNREFNQVLKLGRVVDNMGDRRLYGHNGDVSGSPELFGFFITPL